jgi:hypothetical protein
MRSGNTFFFGPEMGRFELDLPVMPEFDFVLPERPVRQNNSVRT